MNQIIKPLSCVVVLLAILSGCILRKNFAPLQKGFVASWLEHLLSDNTESLYIKGIRSEETVVIILGYKLRSDGTPTEMLEQRIHTAYDIVKEYEAAKYIIVSGGYPLNWKIHGNSEASSMYQFLSRCYDSDIPTFQEFGSTSTKENAIYSLRLLMNDEKFNKIKRIMITTNLYHQTRAVGVFRKIAAMNEFVSRNFIISGIGGSLISESLPRPTITLRNGVWLPTIVRSCPKYDYYQRYDKIDEFSWAVDLSISTKVCGVIITSNKLLSLSDYKLNMKNNNMQTIRLSLGDKTIQPDKEVLLLLDWKDSSREDDWDYFGPPHITTATLEGNTSPIESFRILKSCSAFSEGSDIIVRSIGVKPPKRHHDWATDFLRETIREVLAVVLYTVLGDM